MTLKQFLERNHLEALIPLFEIGHSAQGYGIIDHVPAFYGLWWFPPELFWAYLPAPVGKNPRKTELITMIKEGYMTIWERMVKKYALDIILNCNVKAITRNKDKVLIEGHTGEQEATLKLECDYLIITTPLKKALTLLNDPTDEETDIFSKLHKYILCTTLYTSAPQTTTQAIEYRPYALYSYGHQVFAQRHSGICTEGSKCDRTTKDSWVGYQFVDPKKADYDAQGLACAFLRDLESRGIKDIAIKEQKVWDYFYHFEQEEINQGYPWKILEIQGKNRTLYAGASTCFESVNDVINYNLMMLNRFAPADRDNFSVSIENLNNN